MAVNWLKGLVAPAAQFVGSQQQGAPMGGQPIPGGPPPGGQPYYGGQPSAPQAGIQGMPPGMQQGMPQPGMDGGILDPSQWQTGVRTQGAAAGAAGSPGGVAALEARCAELTNDVASLALFARTLLTVLEDAKVVTRDQFMETKNRLDALDGKIDDR